MVRFPAFRIDTSRVRIGFTQDTYSWYMGIRYPIMQGVYARYNNGISIENAYSHTQGQTLLF